MAVDYIKFNTLTGEIISTGNAPVDGWEGQATEPNQKCIMGMADDRTQKINLITEELEDKTTMLLSINKIDILADGVDSAIISSIPNPTRVIIEGEGKWIVDDGVFEFSTDTVGTYKIIFQSSLFLPEEIIVNAS